MNCPLSACPPDCLSQRRKAFQFIHNTCLDQWYDRNPCVNCKEGIEHERIVALTRPPTCDNCGIEKPDNKASLCFRCAHMGSGRRGYNLGRTCIYCTTPISDNNRSQCCIDCRPKHRVQRFRKTHCVRGHEYTEENSYINPQTGARKCRTCEKERFRNYRKKKKEETN